MASKHSKFELFQRKNGKSYYRLRSRSEEILLTGQGYHSQSSCRRGIASVKVNAKLAKRYKEKTAKNGQSYFVLIAGNNQPIGKSELYRSKSALKR